MTDPKDPQAELRRAVAKKLKFWRKKELSDLYYPLDEIMELFQAREQQLLTELRWQLPESSLEMVAEESEEYAKGFDACSTEVFELIEKYREGLK